MKKMFIVLTLSNIGAEIRCLSSQKLNHLASSVCWYAVLLEHTKVTVKLFPQTRKYDRLAHFLWLQLYNFKNLSSANQLKFTIRVG